MQDTATVTRDTQPATPTPSFLDDRALRRAWPHEHYPGCDCATCLQTPPGMDTEDMNTDGPVELAPDYPELSRTFYPMYPDQPIPPGEGMREALEGNIRNLQLGLENSGYDDVQVTGVFDRATEKAIQSVNRANRRHESNRFSDDTMVSEETAKTIGLWYVSAPVPDSPAKTEPAGVDGMLGPATREAMSDPRTSMQARRPPTRGRLTPTRTEPGTDMVVVPSNPDRKGRVYTALARGFSGVPFAAAGGWILVEGEGVWSWVAAAPTFAATVFLVVSAGRLLRQKPARRAIPTPAPASPPVVNAGWDLLDERRAAADKRWLAYDKDLSLLLTHPVMRDFTDPLTRDVSDRMRLADVAAHQERTGDPAASEYARAVALYESALNAAISHAQRIALTKFTPAEANKIRTAQKLLATALSGAAQPAERRLAYERVISVLDGLVKVPAPAAERIEKTVRAALPPTPTR